MKIPFALLAVICLSACNHTTTNPVLPPAAPLNEYEQPLPPRLYFDILHPEGGVAPPLKVYIDPSHFMGFSFELLADSAILMNAVRWYTMGDSLETVHNRIFGITPAETQSLHNGITQFNHDFKKAQNWEEVHSGMLVRIVSNKLVYGEVIDAGSLRRSEAPEYYRILDPLFLILRRQAGDSLEMAHLRELEQYLDYHLPVELVSTTPHRYRIHGNLAGFFGAQLSDAIDHMPSDAPITIDMSTLVTMDTSLYPHFQRLVKRNNQVHWLATPNAHRHLLALGVPEKNIQPVMGLKFRSY